MKVFCLWNVAADRLDWWPDRVQVTLGLQAWAVDHAPAVNHVCRSAIIDSGV